MWACEYMYTPGIHTNLKYLNMQTMQWCTKKKKKKAKQTGGDSSVVRAPDLLLKGRGFESLLERRENLFLQGRLSVLTLIFGIRSTPVLPQLHVKDPSRSAKSAGGRLQLNTHTPYVCGFAWSDIDHGCMVYTGLAPRRLQFHVAPAMPALDI